MQNPMTWNRKLPTPDEVKAEFPLRPDLVEKKSARDGEIERIFTGEDPRIILIIGPCSADPGRRGAGLHLPVMPRTGKGQG